jgi:CHAD domain-containing protein
VQKRGKKGAEAVAHAVEDAHLGDLLNDAVSKARDLSGSAAQALQDSNLSDLLDDALTRTRKAVTRLDIMATVGDVTKDSRKSLRKQIKRARHTLEDLHLETAAGDALKKARNAASNIDMNDTLSTVRKRAEGVVDNVREIDINKDTAGNLLDTLKEKLADVVDAVRDDLAPKAVDAVQHAAETVGHTVREDVIPAAQDAVERVRDDVLPAASERVSHFVEDAELDKKARKVASAAQSGAGSLSGLLRTLGIGVLNKVIAHHSQK